MKFNAIVLLSALTTAAVNGFAFAPSKRSFALLQRSHLVVPPPTTTTTTATLHMTASSTETSDFASAMPEKPDMSLEEKMVESATACIVRFEEELAEGVDAPPEFQALKDARDNNADDTKLLARRIYELMIERGTRYDEGAGDGKLRPTEFDIPANLDVPEVKEEFSYLYKYGMMLISRGIMGVDECKDIVKERLISKTGQTPEEFDQWLGY